MTWKALCATMTPVRIGRCWLTWALLLALLLSHVSLQALSLPRPITTRHTTLQDSWGASSFSYDQAGRLTSASYPDGSSEQDQYDPAGNRTVITGTTVLSGTSVTTNSYDAADELTNGAVTGQGTTTYSYDGDGNQTGSVGPAGTVTDTYNQQDQLVHVSGPTTNETFVDDGQGDRLRSYEQDGPTWQLDTLTQDLRPGQLSALVSDLGGNPALPATQTSDAYLDFADGQAPLSSAPVGGSTHTYLGTDLVGSVRLTTNGSDHVLGAGGYDAWGSYRAYQGSSGATLLAGLQGTSPFGFAGQYYDAGPGTYDMRAREYSPEQGVFQSEDPQAPDMQVPVTLDPYEYAGDMPTEVTDPSGRDWVYPGLSNDVTYSLQSSIAGQGYDVGGWQGELQQIVQRDRTQFWVPVFRKPLDCDSWGEAYHYSRAPAEARVANIINQPLGLVWDIERVEAYQNGRDSLVRQGLRTELQDNALQNGYWWKTPGCNGWTGGTPGCTPAVVKQKLALGSGYPSIFGLAPIQIDTWQFGLRGRADRYKPGRVVRDPAFPSTTIVAWEEEPGLILYTSAIAGLFPSGAILCSAGQTCSAPEAISEEIDEDSVTAFGVALNPPERSVVSPTTENQRYADNPDKAPRGNQYAQDYLDQLKSQFKYWADRSSTDPLRGADVNLRLEFTTGGNQYTRQVDVAAWTYDATTEQFELVLIEAKSDQGMVPSNTPTHGEADRDVVISSDGGVIGFKLYKGGLFRVVRSPETSDLPLNTPYVKNGRLIAQGTARVKIQWVAANKISPKVEEKLTSAGIDVVTGWKPEQPVPVTNQVWVEDR